MYVGWLAVAPGLYQLQIGMSFESDKSGSCFTQGVWRRRFNGAISLFPAKKKTPENRALTRLFCFLTLCGSSSLSPHKGDGGGAPADLSQPLRRSRSRRSP